MYAAEKGISESVLHEACQQVFNHDQALRLDEMNLKMWWKFTQACSIPLVVDKENIRKIIQAEYYSVMKKKGFKEKTIHDGVEKESRFRTKKDIIADLVEHAHGWGVNLEISSIPTFEQDYIVKMTTPQRIAPYDFELDRYDNGEKSMFAMDSDYLEEMLAE